MSGFIAVPPQPASPIGAVVLTGGFWPDIDLNHFRDTMRVGASTIPDARLKHAIQTAIFTVASDLDLWWHDQTLAGYTTLAAVPSVTIGDDTRLTHLWRTSVYAHATAELTETHRDVSATKSGDNRSQDNDLTACEYRRNAIRAIRAILGGAKNTVELI